MRAAAAVALLVLLTGCIDTPAVKLPEAAPNQAAGREAVREPRIEQNLPEPTTEPVQEAVPEPVPVPEPRPVPVPERRNVTGYDVSWPQCPKGMGIPERRTLGLPSPREDAEFVIIGLTNGPAFTPNPCLKEQVDEARSRGMWRAAYAITTYPSEEELQRHGGSGDAATRLRNVGRAQVRYNLANMEAAGLETPIIWVDVEPSTVRPWSRDVNANNTLIESVLLAYQEAGYAVGLYSYKHGWNEITGGASVPALPAWVPTGKKTQGEAIEGCAKESFNGGTVALGQSTDGVYDYNTSCKEATGDPESSLTEWKNWFHK